MIIEVKSKKDLADFIYLPLKLHRRNPKWVPPVYRDEWKFFDPLKNKSFSYCETIRILAKKENKVVGRAMGIIHKGYNELKNEKNGRFGWFESIDDQEVAHEMLTYIQDWVTNRGLEKLIGPFGFTDKDPQGCLIGGFEYRAVLTTAYQPPYYSKLIENEGFVKDKDLVEYLIPVPGSIPDFYQRIYDRAMRNNHIRIMEFSTEKGTQTLYCPSLKADE